MARIGQQELMFRYDPQVREHAAKEKPVGRARDKGAIDVKEVKPGAASKGAAPKKAGAPPPRRGTPARAGGDGRSNRQRGEQAGESAQAVRPQAIEAGAGNGSKSSDGAKARNVDKAPDGSKSSDGSRADWSKAPRQKPHPRSRSKRTRKSR